MTATDLPHFVPALGPRDETVVDRDPWSIVHWVIAGIGGEWTTDALDVTGRLFCIPASMDGDRPLS